MKACLFLLKKEKYLPIPHIIEIPPVILIPLIIPLILSKSLTSLQSITLFHSLILFHSLMVFFFTLMRYSIPSQVIPIPQYEGLSYSNLSHYFMSFKSLTLFPSLVLRLEHVRHFSSFGWK